eukprot:GHVN01100139.1.p2 GENE.GHVN01100139.1~~GHVN01100139.1.p2  ORF type:complete len:294 (+),score=101.82 GHVN01100139.1:131-1012(+)
MRDRPAIIVFASGTATAGGSGFEELVVRSRLGRAAESASEGLRGDVVAVVSNHEQGGVAQRAQRLGVRFIHFPPPHSPERYEEIVSEVMGEVSEGGLGEVGGVSEVREVGGVSEVSEVGGVSEVSGVLRGWVVLSGWLKLVPIRGDDGNGKFTPGLSPARTVNIHPGPLPRFGGAGLYGRRVHQAVLEAYKRGEITSTGPSMHFVTSNFDEGPQIFHKSIPIEQKDTWETIQAKVNQIEHEWQWWVVDKVVNEEIKWNGSTPTSLKLPKGYPYLPPHSSTSFTQASSLTLTPR